MPAVPLIPKAVLKALAVVLDTWTKASAGYGIRLVERGHSSLPILWEPCPILGAFGALNPCRFAQKLFLSPSAGKLRCCFMLVLLTEDTYVSPNH